MYRHRVLETELSRGVGRYCAQSTEAVMLELSLQRQKIISQEDAREEEEKGSECAKVERYERIRFVMRLVKSSVWLPQKIGNLVEARSLRTLRTV